MKTRIISGLVVLIFISSCRPSSVKDEMTITKSGLNPKDFSTTHADQQVDLFVLTNETGMEVCITNYGARVVSLMAPDRNGLLKDVVLGFGSINDYINAKEVYHGATIGRYANRIANGRFSIQGEEYTLAQNNGTNNLHGGPGGFHNAVWKVVASTPEILRLSYLSEDGEEGFPGNLSVTLTYTLSNHNQLMIEYTASSDKATVVNLTHHSFFNLKGEGSGSILDHELMIDADRFNPVNESLIPVGIESVDQTPFDFKSQTRIGERIEDNNQQLQYGKGYDHNYILNRFTANSKRIHFVAKVFEPESGRTMSVFTDQPGLQFYSGNFMSGSDDGKSGQPYEFRHAFCLETQHFPDSPNQPEFPSTLLLPRQMYNSTTIYKFAAE